METTSIECVKESEPEGAWLATAVVGSLSLGWNLSVSSDHVSGSSSTISDSRTPERSLHQ
jgi:hypothetical protein